MRIKWGLSRLIGGVLLLSPFVSNATIIYDDWSSVNGAGGGGNYIITVEKDAVNHQFDINFTVNPWNAEGLGLFIDLGNINIPGTGTNATAIAAVGLTNITPTGEVTLFNTDTTSNSCGMGCNLNGESGFNPALPADGEWELVFRLGSQGYDDIQTFSFSINDFDLEESNWGVIGVRAQQLCSDGKLHPNDNCGDSDKSTGDPDPDPDPDPVPVPGTLVLMGLGLFGLGWSRKRRATA